MSKLKQVNIVRLNKDLPLPEYKTSGAAGMDLFASVEESAIIKPNEIKLIPTGIAIAMPDLKDDLFIMEAQVRPRSGLALKNGLTVLNTPGTIDLDFRGEIGVILVNHSQEDFIINKGDRIAQLVFNVVTRMKWNEVDSLDETERGEGGYGSTGK